MAIETGSVIYNGIKRYYQMGFYSEDDMKDFVKWGTLTKEQYAAITGNVYPDPTSDTPTKEPTTEEPTTEKPTTEEPTTEKPTTEEPTTEKPTTEEPTTEKPVTEEPSAEEPPTDGNTTS